MHHGRCNLVRKPSPNCNSHEAPWLLKETQTFMLNQPKMKYYISIFQTLAKHFPTEDFSGNHLSEQLHCAHCSKDRAIQHIRYVVILALVRDRPAWINRIWPDISPKLTPKPVEVCVTLNLLLFVLFVSCSPFLTSTFLWPHTKQNPGIRDLNQRTTPFPNIQCVPFKSPAGREGNQHWGLTQNPAATEG